jgi:hypothetical protein
MFVNTRKNSATRGANRSFRGWLNVDEDPITLEESVPASLRG